MTSNTINIETKRGVNSIEELTVYKADKVVIERTTPDYYSVALYTGDKKIILQFGILNSRYNECIAIEDTLFPKEEEKIQNNWNF